MLSCVGTRRGSLPAAAVTPSVRTEALLGCQPAGAPGRWPGLLLGWCQAEGGEWEGRVAYVAHLQNGHALMGSGCQAPCSRPSADIASGPDRAGSTLQTMTVTLLPRAFAERVIEGLQQASTVTCAIPTLAQS